MSQHGIEQNLNSLKEQEWRMEEMLSRQALVIFRFPFLHAEDGIDDYGKRDLILVAVAIVVVTYLSVSVFDDEIFIQFSDSFLIVWSRMRHELVFERIGNF